MAAQDDELEVALRRPPDHRRPAGEPVARAQEPLLLVGRRKRIPAPEDLHDALVAAARAPARGRDDHVQLVRRVEQRPAHDERNAVTGVDEVGGHARSIRARRPPWRGATAPSGRAEWTRGSRPAEGGGLTPSSRSGRLRFVNAYRDPSDPFEALGDATRRAIVEGLRDGERTVGDLAADLPVSRPAVSQHLGVLKAAGLVLERPQGTRRYYRLDPDRPRPPPGPPRRDVGPRRGWGGGRRAARQGSHAESHAGSRADAAPGAAPVGGPAGGKGGGKKHKKKRGRK